MTKTILPITQLPEATGGQLLIKTPDLLFESFRFMIDTGAGRTILFKKVCDELGILVYGAPMVRSMGLGGAIETQLAKVTLMNTHIEVTVTNDPLTQQAMGPAVAGIIGMDLLLRWSAQVDLRNMQVTVYQ